MQFEPVKPADRGLTALGQTRKDAMLGDARILAHR